MFARSQDRTVHTLPSETSTGNRVKRPLAEADAVDIWIARWLRVRRKDLVVRYGCDPRRLYEIWEEKRFPASRDKARALFAGRSESSRSAHSKLPCWRGKETDAVAAALGDKGIPFCVLDNSSIAPVTVSA